MKTNSWLLLAFFLSVSIALSQQKQAQPVTASDYVIFLNETASIDTEFFYNEKTSSDFLTGCIVRARVTAHDNAPTHYEYFVIAGRESMPITFVNETDKAAYCAWHGDPPPQKNTLGPDIFFGSSALYFFLTTAPDASSLSMLQEATIATDGETAAKILETVLGVVAVAEGRNRFTKGDSDDETSDEEKNPLDSSKPPGEPELLKTRKPKTTLEPSLVKKRPSLNIDSSENFFQSRRSISEPLHPLTAETKKILRTALKEEQSSLDHFYQSADAYWQDIEEKNVIRTEAQQTVEAKKELLTIAQDLLEKIQKIKEGTNLDETILGKISTWSDRAATALDFIPIPLPLSKFAETISSATKFINEIWPDLNEASAQLQVRLAEEEYQQAIEKAADANAGILASRKLAEKSEEIVNQKIIEAAHTFTASFMPPAASLNFTDWTTWASGIIKKAGANDDAIERLARHGIIHPSWIAEETSSAWASHILTLRKNAIDCRYQKSPLEADFEEASTIAAEKREKATAYQTQLATEIKKQEEAVATLAKINADLNALEKKPSSLQTTAEINQKRDDLYLTWKNLEKIRTEVESLRQDSIVSNEAAIAQENRAREISRRYNPENNLLLRNKDRIKKRFLFYKEAKKNLALDKNAALLSRFRPLEADPQHSVIEPPFIYDETAHLFATEIFKKQLLNRTAKSSNLSKAAIASNHPNAKQHQEIKTSDTPAREETSSLLRSSIIDDSYDEGSITNEITSEEEERWDYLERADALIEQINALREETLVSEGTGIDDGSSLLFSPVSQTFQRAGISISILRSFSNESLDNQTPRPRRNSSSLREEYYTFFDRWADSARKSVKAKVDSGDISESDALDALIKEDRQHIADRKERREKEDEEKQTETARARLIADLPRWQALQQINEAEAALREIPLRPRAKKLSLNASFSEQQAARNVTELLKQETAQATSRKEAAEQHYTQLVDEFFQHQNFLSASSEEKQNLREADLAVISLIESLRTGIKKESPLHYETLLTQRKEAALALLQQKNSETGNEFKDSDAAFQQYEQSAQKDALKAARDRIPNATEAWKNRAIRAASTAKESPQSMAIAQADALAYHLFQRETERLNTIEKLWNGMIDGEKIVREEAARDYIYEKPEAWNSLSSTQRAAYNKPVEDANKSYYEKAAQLLTAAKKEIEAAHEKLLATIDALLKSKTPSELSGKKDIFEEHSEINQASKKIIIAEIKLKKQKVIDTKRAALIEWGRLPYSQQIHSLFIEKSLDLWEAAAQQFETAIENYQKEEERYQSSAWHAEQAGNNFSLAAKFMIKARKATIEENQDAIDSFTQAAICAQRAGDISIEAKENFLSNHLPTAIEYDEEASKNFSYAAAQSISIARLNEQKKQITHEPAISLLDQALTQLQLAKVYYLHRAEAYTNPKKNSVESLGIKIKKAAQCAERSAKNYSKAVDYIISSLEASKKRDQECLADWINAANYSKKAADYQSEQATSSENFLKAAYLAERASKNYKRAAQQRILARDSLQNAQIANLHSKASEAYENAGAYMTPFTELATEEGLWRNWAPKGEATWSKWSPEAAWSFEQGAKKYVQAAKSIQEHQEITSFLIFSAEHSLSAAILRSQSAEALADGNKEEAMALGGHSDFPGDAYCEEQAAENLAAVTKIILQIEKQNNNAIAAQSSGNEKASRLWSEAANQSSANKQHFANAADYWRDKKVSEAKASSRLAWLIDQEIKKLVKQATEAESASTPMFRLY